MRRARRIASIAVVTTAGLLALAGCRADPGVAAYVGAQRHTEERVTQIYDDADEKFRAATSDAPAAPAGEPSASPAVPADGASASPTPKRPLPITRRDVVVALVGRDMLKGAAERLKVAKAEVPAEQLLQTKALPMDSEFMRIWAEHEGYRLGLLQNLPRKVPTEADMRSVYDALAAGGGLEPGLSFADFANGLSADQRELVSALISLRDALAEQVRSGDVVVNPRYTPAELVLINFTDAQQVSHPLISVPLETAPGEPFVRDAA